MLVIIYGDIGMGKTLLATIMALCDDRPVLCNYKIDCDRYKGLEPQDLNAVNKPTLVVIDEAYAWLDARLSGKDINRYLSYILFQSRKRQIDFILTAQLLSTIDLRFKGMADVYVLCEKDATGFHFLFMWPGKGKRAFYLSMEQALQYFPKYDTWEKVDPIDDNLLVKIMPHKEQLLPEIDRIIALMVVETPVEKWTKGMVQDYCLEHKHPFEYRDMIYNRMRRRAVNENV
jgi:hypothetical protein